jgi:GT2 family glycosyltransferase
VDSVPGPSYDAPVDTIAVVVLTHNRLHLARKCYENVLTKASPATTEVVVWDNGSTDGTAGYFESLHDPRLRLVKSKENIGLNAYAEVVKQTTAPFIVEVDDDVTDAPEGWDKTLLDAFRRLPDVGLLAADLEVDPNDTASWIRHQGRPHEYVPIERHGVRLLTGPVGGACAMTSRKVYEHVGGFVQQRGKIFFQEDAAYLKRIERYGYTAAVLRDLRVHHTGGEYYGEVVAAKAEYWRRYLQANQRRDGVKRVLLTLPFVRPLNERFGWFIDPDADRARPRSAPSE